MTIVILNDFRGAENVIWKQELNFCIKSTVSPISDEFNGSDGGCDSGKTTFPTANTFQEFQYQVLMDDTISNNYF